MGQRSKYTKDPSKASKPEEETEPPTMVSNIVAILTQVLAMWVLSIAIMKGLAYFKIAQGSGEEE